MGQSSSSEPQQGTKTISKSELSHLFVEACSKQFAPIELVTIRRNMKLHDKDQNQLIDEQEFQNLLCLPDNTRLVLLLYGIVKRLAQFPILSQDDEGVNFHGLLKAITLISDDRFGKVLTSNYDRLKLLFIAFGGSSVVSKEAKGANSTVVRLRPNGTVIWNKCPIVETFDGIDADSLELPAEDILEIVSFLLVIARLEPHESLKLYSQSFTHLDHYKQQALAIIRTMNTEITRKNIDETTISFNQFRTVVETVAKNLLRPSSCFLEILLFNLDGQKETETDQSAPPVNLKGIHTTTRLINEFSLAQLSTILRKELVFSNIRKLYVGAESGFSMRSFESKAFKWNAPSILIIRGRRIDAKTAMNPRYAHFNNEFPKFRYESLPFQHDGDEIIYGMYVNQPWRITNKDSFGDDKTEIFQLAPVQKIFKTSVAARNLVYFNTLGGGIGFGSQQPAIKSHVKRYQPGNVSITMDQNLEFAVFRHLGVGGEFKSIDPNDWSLQYEDRFMISDVEVWGCGGEKELEEQNKRWEWEQKEAKRRQQINLKSMGEDRALLEMAGLIGQHQSGGSI